jgi:hypothetical protein
MHRATLSTIGWIATPCSGGFAKNTGPIFVSFGRSDHLVVVDPRTNTIVKNLKTSPGPIDAGCGSQEVRLSDVQFKERRAASPAGGRESVLCEYLDIFCRLRCSDSASG